MNLVEVVGEQAAHACVGIVGLALILLGWTAAGPELVAGWRQRRLVARHARSTRLHMPAWLATWTAVIVGMATTGLTGITAAVILRTVS